MTERTRILHVDDEADIREIVETALALDPLLEVQSCDGGGAALTAAANWSPQLILLDAMMPEMDGPMTLARLRANQETARIPVVFMTARAQSDDVERLIAMGAEGVIAKPFDPMTLAVSVRSHLPLANRALAGRREQFLERVRGEATVLARSRDALRHLENPIPLLATTHVIAHRLAGAGGIFGLPAIGARASVLERAIIKRLEGSGPMDDIEQALDLLLAQIHGSH